VVTNSARNHVAIVTGANHGIGAATAVALAARGCSVLCTFLRIDEPAYRPAKCVVGQDDLAKRRISEALRQN
jgi:NAD(P)-dependent dehydrogenase (short-subunit alcohol dehydrogenase family)